MKKIFLTILILLFTAGTAIAGTTATLTWDAPANCIVDGYNVLFGTASGQYTNSVDVGDTTTVSSDNLTGFPATLGVQYFFVVRAYNLAGESPNSNEANWTPLPECPTQPLNFVITE